MDRARDDLLAGSRRSEQEDGHARGGHPPEGTERRRVIGDEGRQPERAIAQRIRLEVERRARLQRELGPEEEDRAPDLDARAVLQANALDPLPVDPRTVGGSFVLDEPPRGLADKPRVPGRHPRPRRRGRGARKRVRRRTPADARGHLPGASSAWRHRPRGGELRRAMNEERRRRVLAAVPTRSGSVLASFRHGERRSAAGALAVKSNAT